MFAGEIPEDMIEVVEACHVGNECMVEVRFPEGKNLSSVDVEEANAVAIMHKLGGMQPNTSSLVSAMASSPRGYVQRYQVRVMVVMIINALCLMMALTLMRRPSLKGRPSMRRHIFSNIGLSSVRASNLID